MKNAFSRLFLAPLIALALASVAAIPVAEAQGKKGGAGGGAAARAGGGGGGAARAGGGGKKNVQVNNSKKDVRTNNVRNTSVNNVNVNKNVNVNVDADRRGGCCGWDDDYHPVATAAAVTATVAVTSAIVGSIVNAPPPGCVPVNYGGMIYQQCGTTWYQPQGTQYVVINPPY
jgi:hypothetical protein